MSNGSCRNSSKMLKQAASGVLASLRGSTYPRGYVSGLHSLRPRWTAILSILHYSGLSITYEVAPLSFSWYMETIET
jgi:hypothetical protein